MKHDGQISHGLRNRPRLQVPQAVFSVGDKVDLTLPVGSRGEQITTRKLAVAAHRRNKYSGKPEYKLDDHTLNRIDYTRWFEEVHLCAHDVSVKDPVCRRWMKNGKSCASTPLQPSGVCIKHKAKLDWDRERARQKLELDLEKRKPPERKPTRKSVFDSPSTGNSSSTAPPRYQDVTSPTHLENVATAGASANTATIMWGEVDLFANVAQRPRPADTNSSTAAAEASTPYRRTCFIFIALCIATVTVSLSIALWWSLTAHDVSGGFTMAGYIVALGGIVMYPIQSAHSKNCRCWQRPALAKAR